MRYDPYGGKMPTMTRAHFGLIAYVINQHSCETKGDLIEKFVVELSETNDRFDEAKFRQACNE